MASSVLSEVFRIRPSQDAGTRGLEGIRPALKAKMAVGLAIGTNRLFRRQVAF